MFDAGFFEFLFIGVIALLVVGPERLPKLAAEAGRWFAKVRRYIANAKAEMESEFNTSELRGMLSEQQDEIRKLRGMVEDTREGVEKEVRSGEDYMLRALSEENRKVREEREERESQVPAEGESNEDIERLAEEYGESFDRPDFGSSTLTGGAARGEDADKADDENERR